MQIVPLKQIIEKYDGAIFLCKLNLDKSTYSRETLNFNISKIYPYIKNKPYDLNIVDLLSANINLYKRHLLNYIVIQY